MKISGRQILTNITALFVMLFVNTSFAAEEGSPADKYPDRMMFRLGFYNISDTNTDIRVNATGAGGLGTVINFEKDLGGEGSENAPRIDAYYRFNDKHRIDFEWFEVNRAGSRILDIDFTYEGVDYNVGGTVDSTLDSRTLKVAYGYSFYHTKEVELSFSAGLHFMNYEVSLSDTTNNKRNENGVTAPLPVLGMSINYNISDRWLFRYKTQTFYLELGDVIQGSLLDVELDLEYRFTKHFSAGLGITRLSVDAEIEDDDYKGSITDLYRGYLFYVAAYL